MAATTDFLESSATALNDIPTPAHRRVSGSPQFLKSSQSNVSQQDKYSKSEKSKPSTADSSLLMDLLQSMIALVVNQCRLIAGRISGYTGASEPNINYILMLFFLLKDKVASPVIRKYYSYSPTERLFIGGLMMVTLWLPLLLLIFWIIPSAIAFICSFYLIIFGFPTLKAHLEETLNEATGLTTTDIKTITTDFTRNAAENLLQKTGKMELNVDMMIKQNTQRAIAIFGQACVYVLEALLNLVRFFEGSLSNLLKKVQ